MKSLSKAKILKRRYILAIDPGTGSSSPCGVALLDTDKMEIIFTMGVYVGKGTQKSSESPRMRIKQIADKLKDVIESCIETYGKDELGITSEAFVMRGKGGETLAKFKGACIAHIPIDIAYTEVYNTTMKAVSGGKGTATKQDIAEYLTSIFPKGEREKIMKLQKERRWDEIDAIGLAYAAKFEGGE